MKTVGTKLDNSEYEIFEFCCNDLGLTKSEMLRGLIKDFVNDGNGEATPQDLEQEQPLARSTEAKVKRVSYDDGKTWHDVKPIHELTNITIE